MGKKELRELEKNLDYALGAVSSYRRGTNPEFIPHGIEMVNESLEAAKRDLDKLGLYEQCRSALVCAELIKHGSVHDDEAENLILHAARALREASGSAAAMRKKLREKPAATLDDIRSGPDDWAQEESPT